MIHDRPAVDGAVDLVAVAGHDAAPVADDAVDVAVGVRAGPAVRSDGAPIRRRDRPLRVAGGAMADGAVGLEERVARGVEVARDHGHVRPRHAVRLSAAVRPRTDSAARWPWSILPLVHSADQSGSPPVTGTVPSRRVARDASRSDTDGCSAAGSCGRTTGSRTRGRPATAPGCTRHRSRVGERAAAATQAERPSVYAASWRTSTAPAVRAAAPPAPPGRARPGTKMPIWSSLKLRIVGDAPLAHEDARTAPPPRRCSARRAESSARTRSRRRAGSRRSACRRPAPASRSDIQIVIPKPAAQPVSPPIRVNSRTGLTRWSSASSISWLGAALIDRRGSRGPAPAAPGWRRPRRPRVRTRRARPGTFRVFAQERPSVVPSPLPRHRDHLLDLLDRDDREVLGEQQEPHPEPAERPGQDAPVRPGGVELVPGPRDVVVARATRR